jgi:iron complex outermembrane receptor protein
VDVSAFHSEYENLQSFGSVSISLDATPEPPHATIHVPYANGIKGATDGFEVAVDWKPTSRWQLKGFYSYLSLALRNEPGSTDALGRIPIYEGSSPKHQFTIQSRLDLPRGLEFDQIYRYVSALPASQVKAYGTADLRLRWRFAHAFELTVVGKDLLQPRHAELASNPGGVVLIQRGAYANLTWKR